MVTASKVKPTHKPVKNYYAALEAYADQSVEHEGALRRTIVISAPAATTMSTSMVTAFRTPATSSRRFSRRRLTTF